MLLEVRKLLFSDDVIERALLDECALQKVVVPQSHLHGVRVDGYRAPTGSMGVDGTTSKGRVVLEFDTANPDKPYEVVLNEHFVISALILACRKHGIPLPRDAQKYLQMTDRGLALTLSLKMETVPVDTESPSAATSLTDEHERRL